MASWGLFECYYFHHRMMKLSKSIAHDVEHVSSARIQLPLGQLS